MRGRLFGSDGQPLGDDIHVSGGPSQAQGRPTATSVGLKFGIRVKATQTPTLIINGKTYPGALTFEELDKVLKPMVGKS